MVLPGTEHSIWVVAWPLQKSHPESALAAHGFRDLVAPLDHEAFRQLKLKLLFPQWFFKCMCGILHLFLLISFASVL